MQQPKPPATVLLLASKPADGASYGLSGELRAIHESSPSDSKIKSLEFEHAFDVQLVEIPRLLLRVRPDIVHFSGHGNTDGELLFPCPDGTCRAASEDTIADIFAAFADTVQCVVLNACHTDAQAARIAEHINVAIGFQGIVASDTATIFAREFYAAIGLRESVGRAYALAKLSVEIHGGFASTTSHLYANRTVDPMKLHILHRRQPLAKIPRLQSLPEAHALQLLRGPIEDDA